MRIKTNVSMLKAENLPYISKFDWVRFSDLGYEESDITKLIVDDNAEDEITSLSELRQYFKDHLEVYLFDGVAKDPPMSGCPVLSTRDVLLANQSAFDFVRDASSKKYDILSYYRDTARDVYASRYTYAIVISDRDFEFFKNGGE